MKKIMGDLLKIDFLKMVSEAYQKNEFVHLDDEVKHEETVVAEANELEKAVFSVKCKNENTLDVILEEIENTKLRNDLSEKNKEEILLDLHIQQIKVHSDIQTLATMFWGLINNRLPGANKEWDSLGVRKNWSIVGFNINSKETAKSLASDSERCLIDQNDILVLKILNQFYFENQLLVKPTYPVDENEVVVGEMNNFEKVLFNILHFNRLKLSQITEKIKTGESFCLHEVEIVTSLSEVMEKMLWSNLNYRFKQEIGKELGIRQDFRVVSYLKNHKLN